MKKTLIAGFLFVAVMMWLLPIKTEADTTAPTVTMWNQQLTDGVYYGDNQGI